MIKDDLEYIFKKQIDAGETKLCFMLIDNGHKVVERHPADKLDDLLLMLDCFVYAGNEDMPRFVK